MNDHGDVLLRLETEVDRETVARRLAFHARRPPRRSDRWWAGGIGAIALAGWVLSGPSLLWWLGLAAAGLFVVGDVMERRAVRRELAAVPEHERRRVVSIAERGVTVTTADGEPLVSAPWREVSGVRRTGDLYTITVEDELIELPVSVFPSELARGSFEAVAARNDRPVQHG